MEKLTDEQYIERLEYCKSVACCCSCKYEGFCVIKVSDTLDLIHRLQAEKAEQKAEIERLTEERDEYQEKWQTSYMNELNLQKQMDELNKVITTLKYTHLQDECKLADLISTCEQSIKLGDEWRTKFKQVAKEIITKIDTELYNTSRMYLECVAKDPKMMIQLTNMVCVANCTRYSYKSGGRI